MSRKKWSFILTLVFAILIFAMLPQTVLARELSETINTTGYEAVYESSHFEVTCKLYKDNRIALIKDSTGYPITIKSKSDNNISKVELTVYENTGVALNTVTSTKGAVSGSTSVGSTVIISKINATSLQIGTTDDGVISIGQIKIYYDDLISYSETADPVVFNGIEWYAFNYSPDENTMDLLTKDCIGVSQFNPPESNYFYKNSIAESYLKQYYNKNFANVDSAIISITPIYESLNGPMPEGNEAKLWLLGAYEAYKLADNVRKCAKVDGDDNYYWLREAGLGAYQAHRVSCADGKIDNRGDIEKLRGIRPALRLDLSTVEFISETKTIRLKSAYPDVPEPDATPTPTPTVKPKPTNTPTPAANSENSKILLNSKLKATWKGSSVRISWGTVPDADEYTVYAAYCGTTKYGKVNTGKNSAVIKKLNGKKLKKTKIVKLYVVAKSKGKKLAKSLVLHVAGPKNKKYTNAGKIKLSKKKIKVKPGKKATLKAKLVLVNSRKKLLPSAHVAKLRYASSDPTIATVSKKGKIKALKKGSCYVYAYAQNGFAQRAKVIVQ